MRHFILIRHGQTPWNRKKKVQGQTDIPLNATGEEQARELAQALSGEMPAVIFASPLSRAAETARIVRADRDIPLCLIPELTEVGFGRWEGKTLTEIGRDFPEDYARWVKDPAWQTPTGGEAKEHLRRRARQAVKNMLKNPLFGEDDTAIVVSHGGILVYVIAWLLRKQEKRREIIVENASVTRVDYDEKSGAGRLLSMNDITHLDEKLRTPWEPDLRK